MLLSLHAYAASPAKSLEVAPTTLELTAGEPGLLYVANRSTVPVTVQIDIYDWSQSRDGDRLALSDTAFVSPPLTTIAPGERQIVRVLAQPKSNAQEVAYRLRVSELPDAAAKSQGVQVLLQFSIPAFVRGTRNDSAISWTAAAKGTALELKAQDQGGRSVKLAGLRISTSGGASVAVAPDRVDYILPGAEHSWTIDAPQFARAPSLHVEATDERSGRPVAADIVVAR
jgi:fimbrial chaperone protein